MWVFTVKICKVRIWGRLISMRKEQTGVDVSTSLAKHEIRCSKARYRRKKAAAFGAVVFSFHYIL